MCLVVLTAAETLLGRPLSSNDGVGICMVSRFEHRCCDAHGFVPGFFIQRLHIFSRFGERFHRFFNFFSYVTRGPFIPRTGLIGRQFMDADLELLASSSYLIATAWLRTCLTKHPSCRSNAETQLPRRVIFVGHGSEDIRLIENEKPTFGRYTCLSHCWGTKQLLMTTKNNIDAHRKAIDWKSIPKTFQDAINFTQYLGIDFLWIDSLCIIQKDADDWAEESSKMCSIYENSYLTIAATSASDSSQGLSIRDSANFVRLRGLISSDAAFDLVGYSPPHNPTQCRQSNHPHRHHPVAMNPPLFSRAWVFQERIMSPRVVHFNNEELMWECKTTSCCECQPAHFDHTRLTPKSDLKQEYYQALNGGDQVRLVSEWHRVVQEYSALNLSHDTDKLPALSGLAKQYGRVRPSAAYLAGLWSDSLYVDLLWSSHYDGYVKLERGPMVWRAPSWSWAAQNSAVVFPRMTDYAQVFFEMHGFETTTSTPDTTGQVSQGSVVLSGNFHDVHISRELETYQDESGDELKEGALVLTVSGTDVQIKSFLEVRRPYLYRLTGEKITAVVTMDSPYDLLYPESPTTETNEYYNTGNIKCIRMSRFGYKVLLGGRDIRTLGFSGEEMKDYSEFERKEEAERRGEKAGGSQAPEEKKGKGGEEKEAKKSGIGSGSEKIRPQEQLDDRDPEVRDLDPFGRSSAEYTLLLQKVKGEKTYRRIGMLIQHRSLGPRDAPRPLSTLWEDNPSCLENGGILDKITII
ncbi:heterokaryon incompatibility protein-domain-containing protein [Pseudoneurospora amorphoporcata]|uniref:Heterokaryon incompatibility protein-domain-containing protein n=1 Tax=Pseudoneurospora amorphoporcata TaxID=241081 RepID=A0AAN6SJR5_9PEZI|nr:heterokaryon incompatibility protein-domain-containing protein [Pseudoneurospora amorphoporcata]